MELKNSKLDFLTNRQIPIWNFYLNTDSVPSEHKDQVTINDQYILMIAASDPNTNVNGIYAWDGQSWATQAQANAAIDADAGDTSQRPTFHNVGRLYWDTTINKLLVWGGSQWYDTTTGNPV